MFAIGDCCNTDEYKQAYVANFHAQVTAANIKSIASGGSPSKRHKPRKAGMLLPIGAKDGIAEVGGMMLPQCLVTSLKAKQLFVPKTWNRMGYADIKGVAPADSSRARAMQSGSA